MAILTDHGEPRTSSLRGYLTASLLAWALICPAAIADLWYESYEKAERALQNENWPEAIRLLTEAVKAKSDSDARARTYGMNVVSYFPYLKLGVAYHRIGQTEAALQAFDTEERLGAILESDADYAELQRVRGLIRQEREAAAEQERQRIAGIVAESLDEAGRLEDEGKLDEALSELAKARAAAVGHPEATSARQRLLDKMARQQEERDLAARVAQLVEQGRGELSSNRYEEAASSFQRALDLQPNAEIRALHGEAQARLRAQIEAERTEQQRTALIAEGLSEAEALEQRGELRQALDRLQTVLALDPGNRRALDWQDRLIEAQAQADRERRQEGNITTLLDEARTLIDSADYGRALSAANRVLTLDPDNPAAKSYIATAIAQISQQLLSGVRNEPPYVNLDDQREELPDYDTRAELVREPTFLLTGVAVDNSRVELAVLDGSGNEIPDDRLRTNVQAIQDGLYLTSFSLLHRLPAGLSKLTVVATDEHGASRTIDYAVLYRRPFYRSIWFYLVTAVATLGLVLGHLTYRARQRLQRLKRRFNPFVAGAPVLQDELFYGRERLINHVLERIHNNSILLYGERRIGKTSVQHRLKKRLAEIKDPRYTFYAVYIDLQGTPEERFFATMAEEIFQELGPTLDGLKPVVPTSEAAYDYRAFQKDLRGIIKILKAKSDGQVKLVLLIDEVDELNRYDPRVNQKLRSLFMKSFAENLVAVVSGVGIKKHWELEGSPWYNFFQEIEVEPLRRKDAAELIEGPIRGVFKLDRGVIDNILEVTDCKPYLIQKVCAALVNRVHEHKRRRITVADVEAVSGTMGA